MNYPYANGVIKALDLTVLDKSKLVKWMKLDEEAFLKTLVEYGYGNHAFLQLEALIQAELQKTADLFRGIIPDQDHLDLFFFSQDAINIKAYYKKKLFQINSFDLYLPTGTFSKEELEQAIIQDNLGVLPKNKQKLFLAIQTVLEDGCSPKVLSALIDNAIILHALNELKSKPSPALKSYFTHLVDYTNMTTLLRCREIGWDEADLKPMLLDGGTIAKEQFAMAVTQSKEEIWQRFKNEDFERIAKAAKIYFETKKIEKAEQYFSLLLLDKMKAYANDAFTIGPLLYYYLKKQAEAQNLRMIFADQDIELNDLLDY